MRKTITFVMSVLSFLFMCCEWGEPFDGRKDMPKQTESHESALTEKEQKEFEKLGSALHTPHAFQTEKQALKYLRILVKGNEKAIRWYQETRLTTSGREEEEKKVRKRVYNEHLEEALSLINTGTNQEGFRLAVEVLRTKRDYPEALARAALVVKFAHNPSVIPILREVAQHPLPRVRLEAAGSLLSLGDADTALPILDELAEKEGYTGALYYLFSGPGKIIDERGYKIVEKALNNPKAEVAISAIKLLLESKKITNGKAEEVAIEILKELRKKTVETYGLGIHPDKMYERIPMSNMTHDEFEKAEAMQRSDSRACDEAMSFLSRLKSKKAIPTLKQIDSENRGGNYICRPKDAREALEAIAGPMWFYTQEEGR